MIGIFVSWTDQNGRTTDLATVLGLKSEFIRPRGNLVLRYLRSTVATFRVIRRCSGFTVVMLPPTPALVAALAANIGRPKKKVVFDLHTGFFWDPKWKPLLKASLKLMQGYTAIVTNKQLASVLVESGITPIVLDDPIFDLGSVHAGQRVRTIVCPLSYANDEPIHQLLEASKITPEISWTFTGNAPVDVVKSAPKNVSFTGFLSDGDLDRLLKNASAVAALTDRADTMQRAGYESLMRATPLLVSGQSVLSAYFGSSAVYTDNSAHSLAEAARAVMQHTSERIQAMELLREEKILEQELRISGLVELMSLSKVEV